MSPTPWDVPNLLQQGGGGDPETSDHPLTLRCHRNSAGNAGSDLKTPPTTYVESGDLTGCAGGGLRRRQGEETGGGGVVAGRVWLLPMSREGCDTGGR
jgi:hypothetical protein